MPTWQIMNGEIKVVDLQLHHSQLAAWASCGKSCDSSVTLIYEIIFPLVCLVMLQTSLAEIP